MKKFSVCLIVLTALVTMGATAGVIRTEKNLNVSGIVQSRAVASPKICHKHEAQKKAVSAGAKTDKKGVWCEDCQVYHTGSF